MVGWTAGPIAQLFNLFSPLTGIDDREGSPYFSLLALGLYTDLEREEE
jgi:hypothetical protein